MMNESVKIIECPRDAMQGWPKQIPTSEKIRYEKLLLQAGFHTLDFGSFVSHSAVPQMADTAQVLEEIQSVETTTALLAIIANVRGAETAAAHSHISYLGYPLSVSETFQQRNTNASIDSSLEKLKEIYHIAGYNKKELVVYVSMAFGNPYGDDWSEDLVKRQVEKLVSMGINIISLADTVGLATPAQVETLTSFLISEFPEIETGVHLHSTPESWREKIEAAWMAGCRRFDGALKGIGGCPMAGNELVGNMDTVNLISFFEEKGVDTGINKKILENCLLAASEIFS